MTDYVALTQGVRDNVKKLRAHVPEAVAGFAALAKGAMAPGVLDAKTKELIALAVAVGARCEGCIGAHAHALAKLGASDAEVAEALAVAVELGGGPGITYAAHAWGAWEQMKVAE